MHISCFGTNMEEMIIHSYRMIKLPSDLNIQESMFCLFVFFLLRKGRGFDNLVFFQKAATLLLYISVLYKMYFGNWGMENQINFCLIAKISYSMKIKNVLINFWCRECFWVLAFCQTAKQETEVNVSLK